MSAAWSIEKDRRDAIKPFVMNSTLIRTAGLGTFSWHHFSPNISGTPSGTSGPRRVWGPNTPERTLAKPSRGQRKADPLAPGTEGYEHQLEAVGRPPATEAQLGCNFAECFRR